MGILIDPDRCSGHGRCYSLSPTLFDVDDQGRGVLVVDGPLTDAQRVNAEIAVSNCPEQAISIVA